MMPSQNHKRHNMKAVASNTIVYFKAGKNTNKSNQRVVISVPRIVDLVTVNNTPSVRATS